jgi:nucleoid-associated protein YgaU
MFGSELDIEHAFDQAGSVTRTRVRRRLVALMVAAGIAGAVSGPMSSAMGLGRSGVGPRRTVVRRGDTLWSIATRFEPSKDPRVVVDAIARANRVDPGSLVPGQQLVIPG